MRCLVLAACLPCLAAAAAAPPRLVPLRDVTVSYAVHPRDHADVSVEVAIQAGGAHLRITSPDLPTAFLVDRPSHEATILLPMLNLYATVGIGQYDVADRMRHAAFERRGPDQVAGLACTEWRATSADGAARACITEDGVILRGTASDRHGKVGSVQATAVHYGPLPDVLFRRPAGFHNAGSLPVDGLPGFSQ